MNWHQVKSNWLTVESAVKLKWGKFDEADLAMIDGKRESFAKVLAQHYGYTRKEAEKKLDDFIDDIESPDKGGIGSYWYAKIQTWWFGLDRSQRT
jgi:uncharacterized protein YjbJ (UPF0337 family)